MNINTSTWETPTLKEILVSAEVTAYVDTMDK